MCPRFLLNLVHKILGISPQSAGMMHRDPRCYILYPKSSFLLLKIAVSTKFRGLNFESRNDVNQRLILESKLQVKLRCSTHKSSNTEVPWDSEERRFLSRQNWTCHAYYRSALFVSDARRFESLYAKSLLKPAELRSSLEKKKTPREQVQSKVNAT